MITFYKNGKYKETKIKNDIIATPETELKKDEKEIMNINSAMEDMRRSSFVRENKFGNISAFNFTERAFRKGIWDEITTKARGLFINTNTNKVVARSYDKFFRINEVEETQTIYLKSKFQYPLKAYVKYNGFLGILGYDEESDKLLITSKSSLESDHVNWFKELIKDKDLEKIKNYLKDNNSSMVFEVMDIENDPHIIKYNESQVILLDVIKNDLNFSKLDYEELQKIGLLYGFKVKELAYELNNTQEFWNWYYEIQEEDYKYKNEYIEGFVIEDANGFIIKVKLDYYNNWKFMRSVFQEVKRQGYIGRTSKLTTKFHNDFYNWCVSNKENLPEDIIKARDMYYGQ